MALASVALSLVASTARAGVDDAPALRLSSPFSLQSALKFGLIFLVLQVTGTPAERGLG